MTSLAALIAIYKKPLALLAIIVNTAILGIIGYNIYYASSKKNDVECHSSSMLPPQNDDKTMIGEEPPQMLDELIPTAGFEPVFKFLDPQLIDPASQNVLVSTVTNPPINVTLSKPQIPEFTGDLFKTETTNKISNLPLKSHLREMPSLPVIPPSPELNVPVSLALSESKNKSIIKQRREAKKTIAEKKKNEKKRSQSNPREEQTDVKVTVVNDEPPKKNIVATPEIVPFIKPKQSLTFASLRKHNPSKPPLIKSKSEVAMGRDALPPRRSIISVIQPKWPKNNFDESSTSEVVEDEIPKQPKEEDTNQIPQEPANEDAPSQSTEQPSSHSNDAEESPPSSYVIVPEEISSSTFEEEDSPNDTEAPIISQALTPQPQPDSTEAGAVQLRNINTQALQLSPRPTSASSPYQNVIARLINGFSLSPRSIFSAFNLSSGISRAITGPPKETSAGWPVRNIMIHLNERRASKTSTNSIVDSKAKDRTLKTPTNPVVDSNAHSQLNLLDLDFSDAQDLSLVIPLQQIESVYHRFINELTLALDERSGKPIFIFSDLFYGDIDVLKSLLTIAKSNNIFQNGLRQVGNYQVEIKAIAGVDNNVEFGLIIEDYEEPVSTVQVEELVDDDKVEADFKPDDNRQITDNKQIVSAQKKSYTFARMFSNRRLVLFSDPLGKLRNSTKIVIRIVRPFEPREDDSLVVNQIEYEIERFVSNNEKNTKSSGIEIVPYKANEKRFLLTFGLSQLAVQRGKFSFLGQRKTFGKLQFGDSGMVFMSPYLRDIIKNHHFHKSVSKIFKSPSLNNGHASGWMVASFKPEKTADDTATMKATTISQAQQAQAAGFVFIIVLRYAVLLNLQQKEKNQRFPNINVDLSDAFSLKSHAARRHKPFSSLKESTRLSSLLPPIFSAFVDVFTKNTHTSPTKFSAIPYFTPLPKTMRGNSAMNLITLPKANHSPNYLKHRRQSLPLNSFKKVN